MTAITLRGGDGERIAVTGVGMVSSLGMDAVSACAAARAGLSRAAPIADVIAWDASEAEPVPVNGHAVRQLTQGFSGLGRLIRLAMAAWDDLDRGVPERPSRGKYGLYVATTNGYYRAQARGSDVNPAKRAEIVAAVEAEHQASVASALVPRLVKLRGVQKPNVSKIIIGQQAAFVGALIEAVTDLRSGAITEAIVGAVDSLVDPKIMGALARLGLLKSPDNPAGVAPGEGAAFLRLTRASSVSRDQAPVATVAHVSWDKENTHRFAEESSLEQTLLKILVDAPPEAQSGVPPLIIGTLNGDPLRAMEWGTALISLPRWAHDGEHLYPAASFGEVGAAAAAMSAVLGVRTFARAAGRYSSALIWAGGDDGGRGVVWLQPATGAGGRS